jgi:hypothetical protein
VSDIAILGWGMMIGSWITSLWIMHRHDTPTRSAADQMLEEMAGKVDRALVFAPDCAVVVHQNARVRTKLYRVEVHPVDAA